MTNRNKFTNGGATKGILINTPGGVKRANKLNRLADQLKNKSLGDSRYKQVKVGFEMGFDGVWEMVVKNTKTDRAIVLKENPQTGQVLAFFYLQSFSTQASDNQQVVFQNDLQIYPSVAHYIETFLQNNSQIVFEER
jgi:hypothetical protein